MTRYTRTLSRETITVDSTPKNTLKTHDYSTLATIIAVPNDQVLEPACGLTFYNPSGQVI